ncbi:MAG: hypothetical protein K2N03_03625 [Muribaculaceae bacterium]|nr:hypothetical protein [Muribaculaceae bacterium]
MRRISSQIFRLSIIISVLFCLADGFTAMGEESKVWGYNAGAYSQEKWSDVRSNKPESVELIPYSDPEYSYIDSSKYLWDIDVRTQNPDVNVAVATSNSSQRTVTFACSQSPINEVILTTSAFSDKKIKTVSIQAGTSISNTLRVTVVNGTFSQSANATNGTNLENFTYTVNSQASELKILLENLSAYNNSFVLKRIEVEYLEGEKLLNAELVLPLFSSIEWNPELTFEGKGYFNSAVDPKNLEMLVSPEFDIPSEVGNSSEDQVATVDAGYIFNAYGSVNDQELKMVFPCSGVYTVTLRTREDAVGVIPSSITRTYNIYPSDKGLSLNWVPVVSGPTHVIYLPEPDKGVHLDFDAEGCEAWYKIWNTNSPDVAMVAEISDTLDGPVPTVPEDYKLYGAKGLPMYGGNMLGLYLTKNHSVSQNYQVFYSTTSDVTVGIDNICGEDEDSEDNAGETIAYITDSQGRRIKEIPLNESGNLYIITTKEGKIKKILR